MSVAAPHIVFDERARLKELHEIALMDTPPEAEFDALVRLAAIICNAPTALITLIDESRQWFKSRYGIDATETPRSLAFCAHTILQRELLIVEDATVDPRFAQHPAVIDEPHLRFYAGAPLVTASGHALGSLCVLDYVPRSLDNAQREALHLLAQQVVSQIERRRAQANLVLVDREKQEATERLRQSTERESETRSLLQREVELRQRTEQVNRALDEFISMLSHELRTPLNAILGWAQLLGRKNLNESQIRQGTQAIERSARAQARIIDDLLTLNRILAGDVKLNREVTNVGTIVRGAIDGVEGMATEKRISLHCDGCDNAAALVLGDPSRLRQLVSNLLSNAVRFSLEGARVQVMVRSNDSTVELCVQDTGIGIAPDFLPYVFDRFRQADASHSRKFGGMGLGLTITKALVEAHGGSIQAESAGEGKGACFTVLLPRVVARAESESVPRNDEPSAERDALQGRRVLVVEDDADSLDLVVTLLRERGAEVVGATNAAEGLAQVHRFGPDVIISDIGMPVTDGYAFIEQVRKDPKTEAKTVPALALTAFADDKERSRALASGFNRHMSKPFDGKELIRAVSSLLA